MARIDGKLVAAVGSRPDALSAGAAWNTYVAVNNADAAAARAQELGGSVMMGPMDVGDAGRMAALADPEGAYFFVWQAGRRRRRAGERPGVVELLGRVPTLQTGVSTAPRAVADVPGAIAATRLTNAHARSK